MTMLQDTMILGGARCRCVHRRHTPHATRRHSAEGQHEANEQHVAYGPCGLGHISTPTPRSHVI
eukprot:scaffold29979_cov132-Isochrysis_galbana.AAC.1